MIYGKIGIGLDLMNKYFEETHCEPYESGRSGIYSAQYISWLEERAAKSYEGVGKQPTTAALRSPEAGT